MRGTGWISDPWHVKAPYAHSHLVGIDEPPRAAEVLYMPPVKDQGNSSACVGFANATNLSSQLERPLSEMAIYTNARAITRDGLKLPLVDEGSYPWAAAEGIEKWGVAETGDWPFNLRKINTEPTLEQEEACQKLNIFKWAKITSVTDADFIRDLKRAVARNRCVSFGINVTDAFMNYSGGLLDTLEGQHVGGHYLCLYKYDGDVFRVRNSWSELWGIYGDFACTAGFLAKYASDAYVFDAKEEP